MSTTASPITLEGFAMAIADLPLENIYAKVAEIQNSISHLLGSNIQMKPFADEGDDICREAIQENDNVIETMEERVGLCKVEVEKRGMVWLGSVASNGEPKSDAMVNGDADYVNGQAAASVQPRQSGRLGDDELRRQLEARMGQDDTENLRSAIRPQEDEESDDAGVHL